MSQISVLGFKPSSTSSDPSDLSGATHWAILISPHPPSGKPPKAKSRFFHSRSSAKEPQPDSVLFDMHKHQLRQQPFPIPLKEEQEEGSSTNTSQSDLSAGRALMGPATARQRQPSLSPSTSTTNSHQPTPETLTITTLNAESTRPLQLALRIRASILPHPPQRLIPKLSQRLYDTPTYGPETDWLRAALCMLHDGLLEPGFDVDKFFEYVNSAAKEYALYEASSDGDAEADDGGEQEEEQQQQPHLHASTRKDPPVISLDYTAHIAQMAHVKAMLNQQQSDSRPEAPLTPPKSPELPSSSTNQPPPPPPPPPQQQQQQQKKQRTWLGFRISPSPSSLRSGRGIPERRRHSFERSDDPYSGLM